MQTKLATRNVKQLKAISSRLSLPTKGKKAELIEQITIHFTEKSKAGKVEVLEKVKKARKAKTTKGRLSATFFILKDEIEKGNDSLAGITFYPWKVIKTGDIPGITVRFTGEKVTGIDRAILSHITKALKGLDLTVPTITIRPTGRAVIFAK